MTSLIIKLGASGDVVRTTPLIKRLGGQVIWLTESKNIALLEGIADGLQCFSWENRELIPEVEYDVVINLEDTLETARFAQRFKARQWFGAYLTKEKLLQYTNDSRGWFDLSLISVYGREEADRLKFRNRSTYQQLIFNGLGFKFEGDPYLLAEPIETPLSGDVAVASEAGPVWPMKNWAYYSHLKRRLEENGLTVNILPRRASLLEHLGDVRNHRCFVGGDSLPMHFALASKTPCIALFTCTSPWEIYGYGVLRKIVSPFLREFFYKRGYDHRATTSISLDDVLGEVYRQLNYPPKVTASLVSN
jgi:ADP-heptose:LPS heptosyltransferase